MSSAIYPPTPPSDPTPNNQQNGTHNHRGQAHSNHSTYNPAAVAAIAVTAAATFHPQHLQQKGSPPTHFGHPQQAQAHLATVIPGTNTNVSQTTARYSPPSHQHPQPFMSLPSPSPSMPAALATPSNPLSTQLQTLSLPPRLAFPKTRYTKIRTIRQTLMGKVVLYVDTTTNRKVAIKLSNKELLARGTTSAGNKVAENPLEEIRIMNILNGNLIKNGVIVGQLPADMKEGENYVLTSLGEYEDESFLYTVLPFCGKGEFFDIVCRETRFSETKARHYFIQMLKGVRFMHTLTMVHLDLSLENLLMTDDDILKICDYGLTRHLEFVKLQMNDGSCRLQMMPFPAAQGNKPGKLGYMAPEIFSSQAFSGPLADVWSMGVVLFISLFGVPPYQVPAPSDQRFQLIHTGRILQLLQAWKMENLVSSSAIDLMSRMMSPEAKRLSVDDIFRHPWIQEGLATEIPIPNNRLNGTREHDEKQDTDVQMHS